jgi:uncharacterized protein
VARYAEPSGGAASSEHHREVICKLPDRVLGLTRQGTAVTVTAMDRAATVDDIRPRLADIGSVLPELDLLVLFGSVATGRAHEGSDMDVAVLCRDAADLDRLHLALAPRCRSGRLDLIDLRHIAPLLAFAVAGSGQLLYEREPGRFREFQSLAWRRYVDTKRLRDAQRRSLQVFLSRPPA